MTYRLTLTHINDTHSHFDPSLVQFKVQLQHGQFTLASHSGGYSRIAAQVTKLRQQAQAQQREMLFLHAGDSFHGTLFYSEFKGRANARLLELLRPNAMTIGNHDIDDGNAVLADFIRTVSFPVMAANMDISHERPEKIGSFQGLNNLYPWDNDVGIGRYLLRDFYDQKLAIIGITLDQMNKVARPDPDTVFLDAIATTKATVSYLKQQGVAHILLLSHLGIDQDRQLATEVPDISLIIGGHTHTLMGEFTDLGLPCLPYAESINGIPIVHAGKHAETLGIADIEFDDRGRVTKIQGSSHFMLDRHFLLSGETAALESDYREAQELLANHSGILWDEQDERISQVIDSEFRPAISNMEQQVLAFVPKTLLHTRLPSHNLPHGSEIAPWVSQSMFLAAKAQDPRVNFALHNAGGVRQSLVQGQVTLADVMGRLLPFELPLVKYEIAGDALFRVLESAINAATNNSVMGTGAGSFPYTYGLRYFYDGRLALGQRLFRLELQDHLGGWQALQRDDFYIGVSTSYTASGKEGYDALLEARWQQALPEVTLPSAFIRLLQQTPAFDTQMQPMVYYTSHLTGLADSSGISK
ncbi:bifunctional metallophosphatase/5'-nucleotidase [Shewanella yunxiaonensis]|uniref:Bifunctional metallophosphatase/5'-nucleotidase n=1 Tax=Shewanella yunxiaonensis TaxID=2829809 RepID=A0ABX7YPR8_9GAMM|nr:MULTISPECIES: bifunctional metallophosphatase/5'-nucleotidase [Shewanella]MDF0534830.1 bifunctional metallophosphatase/5'-nucleotidase [Shewanella sp. A32]QUN04753.1 bifunctional metallophosphatase/5'-nucleotidase [Shewanella yunxiaonensis]